MKILLVHNYYGSAAPSGENRVFEMERDLLKRHGHEVKVFQRHSDTLRALGAVGKVAGAVLTPWNPATVWQMRQLIASFRPDIVHAHNTFPLISPSVFRAARGTGRVLTLHNYRLVCPAALPMRNGAVCTLCIDRQSVRPALRYGCYRDSRPATVPLAANVALHRWRGTWRDDVSRFIALTEFQREMMVRGGLPRDKIMIKPNFYPGEPNVVAFEDRPNRVVFVGRISAEKGVRDLVDAWLSWGGDAPELRIVGEGPQRAELEKRAAGSAKITFLGKVSSEEAEREIAIARLLLVPSLWFEGFPMVLREAFAFGTPVGVSDMGPLPGLVADADGIVFKAGDPLDLKDRVAKRLGEHPRFARMSKASSALFRKQYIESVNYSQLLEIYEQAIVSESKDEGGTG